MIRILNIVAIVALVGSAIYAYSIKYRTIFHAEQVAKLKLEIKKEKDRIGHLRADWANLTRPERVQELAAKLTELQPLALNQIAKVDALPAKAAPVDVIGHKLEDLGLSEPTNTPSDAAPDSVTSQVSSKGSAKTAAKNADKPSKVAAAKSSAKSSTPKSTSKSPTTSLPASLFEAAGTSSSSAKR